MQNNQNNTKRDFYTDIDLQKEMAAKLAEKINPFLPDDQKIKKEEIENLKYEFNRKLTHKEEMEKTNKAFQNKIEIKEKYENEHQLKPKFGRALPLLLDNNVKYEANEKRLSDAYGKDGTEFVEKNIMRMIANFDMTSIVPKKEESDYCVNCFRHQEESFRAMWAIDSMLDKNSINPENKVFEKIYNDNLNLFETASYTQNMANKATFPFNFIMPERFYSLHDQDLNMKILNFTYEILEEYRNVLDDSIPFDKNTGKYAKQGEEIAAIIQTDYSYKEAEFLRQEIKSGNITKDFLTKKHYQIDGKDATMKQVFDVVREDKKGIQCIEYPADVQFKNEKWLENAFLNDEQIKARIYHDNKVKEEQIYDKQAKEFGKSLAELNNQMNKTHYIFSRDTDEFKKMDKQLNKFTKMFYHANPDLAKEVGYKLDKDFAKKNDLSKESLMKEYKELKEKLSDYYEKKTEIKENSKNKKLNDRGEKRLAATIDIFNKMTGSNIKYYASEKKTQKQKEARKEEALRAEKALADQEKQQSVERVNINDRSDLKVKLDSELKVDKDKITITKQEQSLEKSTEMSKKNND